MLISFGLKMLEKPAQVKLSAYLNTGQLSTTWLQAKVSVLILHFILTCAATMWLVFATNLPPPLTTTIPPHPFGDTVMRIVGTTISIPASAMLLLPLLVLETTSPSGRNIANWVISGVFWGILCALAWIAYRIFLNPNVLISRPPALSNWGDAASWWYGGVATMALSTSLAVLAIKLTSRVLWQLAGKFVSK
jgi:hypothetical protein